MKARLVIVVALAAIGFVSAGAARAQPAQFVFIEIEERHQDLAPEEAAGPSGKRMVFPYVFDSRRGILRPTAEVQGEDFLQGNSVIVLHRISYEGQRRTGSYWAVHRFSDLPAEIDLQSVPEKHNIELSADEQNRFVRPIRLSWGKGKTPLLRIEYGAEGAEFGLGQGWTSRRFWLPAVFSGLRRPAHVGSGVSVRFWGRIGYTLLSEQDEVELLLPLLREGYPTCTEGVKALISIGDAAIPGLVRVLKGAPEKGRSEEKELALSCLRALHARQAVPQIIQFLDSVRTRTADTAAKTLGALGDARAVDPLLRIVRERKESFLVRTAAAALGYIGDKRATPALENLLAEANPQMRLAGATGLALMGRRDVLELARNLLRTDGEGVSSDAMQVLWVLGGPVAQEALADFAGTTKNERIRRDLLRYSNLIAVRQSGRQERRKLLLELLEGKGADRIYARYELDWLDTEEGVAILREAIARADDKRDRVRSVEFRSMLWPLLARKAWKQYEAKGSGEKP